MADSKYSALPPAALLTGAEIFAVDQAGTSVRTTISAAANNALGTYTPPGIGAVARTVSAKLNESISILDFGAVGDGATNNFTALSSAIVYAKATGQALLVPPGNFLIDTASGTLSCSYVTFIGSGVTKDTTTPATGGSVFSIASTTNSPFTIGPGVSFIGIGFYYPAQVDSAAPIVFPPTMITSIAIAGAINFVRVEDCTVFNAYRFFVDTDAGGNIGHILFVNNVIYGILTCYEIAYNAEVIKWLGNNHTFGHFLAATEGGLRGYTRANGSVLKFTRTDGFVFDGNLCYGYLNGILFQTVATACLNATITSNIFDQVLFPINGTGTGSVGDLQISANTFLSFNPSNTAAAGNCILLNTSGALALETVQIAGNWFGNATRQAILVSGNTAIRSLNIASNSFNGWASFVAAGGPYGAIDISGTSTSFVADANNLVSNSATFCNGIVSSGCSLAVASGNIIGTCFNALNITGSTFVGYGNVSYGTGGTVSDVLATTNIYTINNFWDKGSGSTTRTQMTVRKNAAQTFATAASGVACTFPASSYDKGANWTAGTSTFTAKQAARYRFTWMLMHDNTATAGERWTFTLTPSAGAGATLSYVTIANYNCFNASIELDLPNAATVQLLVSQQSGTHNLVTFNDPNSNYMSVSIVE